jgi:hypothetical protein
MAVTTVSGSLSSEQGTDPGWLHAAGYLWAISLSFGLVAPLIIEDSVWIAVGFIAVSVLADLAWGVALGIHRSPRLRKWSMVAAPTVAVSWAAVGWALLYWESYRTEEVHFGAAAVLALLIGAVNLVGIALTVALGWAVGLRRRPSPAGQSI